MTKITTDAQALAVIDDAVFVLLALFAEKSGKLRAARDHIAARLASTSPAPDGLVLVPMVATPQMRDAGIEPYRTENVRDSSLQGKCGRILAAMIAAAPQPVVEKDNG